MVDIILDYTDSTKTIERKFINDPEGDGGKGRRSENQINRVYYVIVLVRNRGHLFKRSRFGATKAKKKLFRLLFFLSFAVLLIPRQ